jgi:uncharacterized membrane-anchored protein
MTPAKAQEINGLFDYLTKNETIDDAFATTVVSQRFMVPAAVARKAIKKHRILVKQQKDASG